MEFGLSSFVEITPDPATGRKPDPQQRLADLMEEIKLADQLGLDVFAVGEHHRPDFVASSPAVILAAAAAVTQRIKLSSAVTVLSSDDPVRVFQQFATLDLLSKGRAEIIAGRGSFIESFPLFGYDLNDYDELFSEKLELLLKLNESEKISWSGKFRAPLKNSGIYPRPYRKKIPVWIGVGGTPESAIRAGKLALPMALAIIGGTPDRFVPFVDFFRESAKAAGHDINKLELGINSHGFLADTSQEAVDIFYPPYAEVMSRIGKERGWQGMDRRNFDFMRDKHGSLFAGSPQEVIEKILYEYELFHHTRFIMQMSVGTVPHDKMMHSIELFGNVVVPAIRKALK